MDKTKQTNTEREQNTNHPLYSRSCRVLYKTEHLKQTKNKTQQSTNIYKAIKIRHKLEKNKGNTNTHTAITRPILEYRSTIWSLMAKKTNINSIQTIQNSIFGIATRHTQLHASNYRLTTTHFEHPLPNLHLRDPPDRIMKQTIFNTTDYATQGSKREATFLFSY